MKAVKFFAAAAFLISCGAFAHEGHNKACKPVWDACVKAKGKKEAKACVKSIKAGETVEGVTVADADLSACKEAKK